MANAKGLSLRGGQRPTWRPEREARGSALGVQSRGGSCDFADGFPVVRPGTARLPRRFAPRNDTSGRHSDGNGAAHRIGGTTAASRTGGACPAPTGPVRIERRLVQIGNAFPRLPRRFAPRNDTSGQRSNGNGAAHRIGGTTAASRTGLAVPAPTGPVRIERRPAYDPFFILQYSLFIISSIPLRGMANHMTKRPEIPCLSCKFPQSRRICH